MAEVIESKSIWQIFFEGLKIYCFNFHKFFLYMAFPVFGQIIALGVILGLTYYYSTNMVAWMYKYPAYYLLLVIVTVLPAMVVFLKAFWDYLVAYGALNSMTESALTTGKVYDFKAHNLTVIQKTGRFILLWLLFGIFSTLAFFPLFWVIGLVFFIYFILIFQVFTFEDDVSPIGYFKRSLALVKGNFARTFCLMTILALISAYIFPMAISVIFDFLNLTNALTGMFDTWVRTLPLEAFYETAKNFGHSITSLDVAKNLVSQLIIFIVLGFTLPLRSICWTLWYKNLNVAPTAKSKRQPKRKNCEEE